MRVIPIDLASIQPNPRAGETTTRARGPAIFRRVVRVNVPGGCQEETYTGVGPLTDKGPNGRPWPSVWLVDGFQYRPGDKWPEAKLGEFITMERDYVTIRHDPLPAYVFKYDAQAEAEALLMAQHGELYTYERIEAALMRRAVKRLAEAMTQSVIAGRELMAQAWQATIAQWHQQATLAQTPFIAYMDDASEDDEDTRQCSYCSHVFPMAAGRRVTVLGDPAIACPLCNGLFELPAGVKFEPIPAALDNNPAAAVENDTMSDCETVTPARIMLVELKTAPAIPQAAAYAWPTLVSFTEYATNWESARNTSDE
jgi:hypothetical protein